MVRGVRWRPGTGAGVWGRLRRPLRAARGPGVGTYTTPKAILVGWIQTKLPLGLGMQRFKLATNVSPTSEQSKLTGKQSEFINLRKSGQPPPQYRIRAAEQKK